LNEQHISSFFVAILIVVIALILEKLVFVFFLLMIFVFYPREAEMVLSRDEEIVRVKTFKHHTAPLKKPPTVC
jgi:hypothetical protein